jgi:hypothetical protein
VFPSLFFCGDRVQKHYCEDDGIHARRLFQLGNQLPSSADVIGFDELVRMGKHFVRAE